jgi:hypothetical protein
MLGPILTSLLALSAVERPRLLAMSLKAEGGVEESQARLLTEALLSELGRDGRFDVYGESDLQQMLTVEVTKQRAGCESDVACLAELGGALGAERVIFGSLGLLGESFLVNLKVIHIKGGRVEARWSGSAKDQEELLEALQAGVRQLLAGMSAPPVAAAGEAPAAARDEDTPIYKRWWFWGAAGVLLAGGGAAAWLLSGDDGSDAGPQPTGTVAFDVTVPQP